MINPTQKQIEFMDWEMGVFFHFGIRTYYEGHTDWDDQTMDASVFNPKNLDCRQWIKTVKEAGAKYAILVCKHHDGFALWPSGYTEYSVKNTHWRDGCGDVVRDFTDACHEYGIKVGLYYSPAQMGTAMNSSEEYDDYFVNQITELLSDYGKIDYLWFDGCGSEDHVYDSDRIIKVIRNLQPDILIFNMWDPDVLWCGNEEGIMTLGKSNITDTYQLSVNKTTDSSLGKKRFFPYECDCRIRRFNWFYSDSDLHFLRGVGELEALYEYSVGRGANLLVNIAPDRNGLLPEEDVRVFTEFGKRITEKYSKHIDCDVVFEKGRAVVTLPEKQSVNCIVLKEMFGKGTCIDSFSVKVLFEHEMNAVIYKGEYIGHKHICRFPEVYTDKFEITFENGTLESVKLHFI